MADFSSALYLGLRHAHGTLQPWAALTTGRPAGLGPLPGAEAMEREIARLTGCARATLASSTLHLFFDLFEVLAEAPIGICIETGSYAIARWGVERVAAQGVPVQRFAMGDTAGLARRIAGLRHAGLRPVVVADGLCPASGRPAPLPDYLRAVRQAGGWLVVDDTQAFGILGERAKGAASLPYGRGGGGTAAWLGLRGPALIVACSLAKGLGVPLATLAGSAEMIERFERSGLTRQHCSAPSSAHLSAASRALALNRERGEALRHLLARKVARFRGRLQAGDIAVHGGLFPVQTPELGSRAPAIHRALRARGITGVLHDGGGRPRLSFLITAAHSNEALDEAADALLRLTLRQHEIAALRGLHHGPFAELQA